MEWHKQGLVSSSIKEFQFLSKRDNQYDISCFDPLSDDHHSNPDTQLLDMGMPKPSMSGMSQTTPFFQPGIRHAPFHSSVPGMGLATNYSQPKPATGPGTYQADQFSQFGQCQSLLPDENTQHKFRQNMSAPEPSLKTNKDHQYDHHFMKYNYDSPSDPRSNLDQRGMKRSDDLCEDNDSTASTQQGLLAIVDGLHRLGETLCNNAREQQLNQERFMQRHEKFFSGLESRFERHEGFFKQLQEALVKKESNTQPSLNDSISRQLESVMKEVRSVKVAFSQMNDANNSHPWECISEVSEVGHTMGPAAHKTETLAPPSPLDSVSSTGRFPPTKPKQKGPSDASGPYKAVKHAYPANNIYQPQNSRREPSPYPRRDTAHNNGHLWSSRSPSTTGSNNTNNANNTNNVNRTNNANNNNANQTRKLQSSLIENFEGDSQLWEGWKKNFLFVAEACEWSPAERLLMLRTHIRGNAVKAIQNLSDTILQDYQAIINALETRYGASRESTKTRLRAELSTIKQLETEDLETFSDRVHALTLSAHPPTLEDEYIQRYAVDAFLAGCKDRSAAFFAATSNPTNIRDAVDQVKAVQVHGARTGSKLVARQVSFEGDGHSSRQSSRSPLRCYTCNGYGHLARDCANKRRRSPSPYRCYECNGTGHMASECANRLRRSSPHSGSRSGSQERGRTTERGRYGNSRASPSPSSHRSYHHSDSYNDRHDSRSRNYSRENSSASPHRSHHSDNSRQSDHHSSRTHTDERHERRSRGYDNSPHPNYRASQRNDSPRRKDQESGGKNREDNNKEARSRSHSTGSDHRSKSPLNSRR